MKEFVLENVGLEEIAHYASQGARLQLERSRLPIGFGQPEGVAEINIEPSPTRAYTARAKLPFYFQDEPTGMDLWVIIFGEGDGTGDLSTFSPKEIAPLDPSLASKKHSEGAAYPRAKSQLAEITLPLTHIRGCIPGVNKDSYPSWSLDTRVCIGGVSGVKILGIEDWFKGLKRVKVSGEIDGPTPHVTLGTDSFGRRVGDPHSIFLPVNSDGGPMKNINVLGFVAATTPAQLDLLAESFRPTNPYTT